jgi:hypothetical protein
VIHIRKRAQNHPKTLFLSLYSNQEHYSEHQLAQLRTWLGSKKDIYWLRGVGENKSPSFEENYINCPVVETFENILTKRIMGLKYALSKLDYDFYVFTNTSTFINLTRLENFVSGLDKNKALAAAALGFYSSSFSEDKKEFLAGNLIILSKKAATELVKMNPKEWEGVADDIAISEYLKKNDCELHYIKRNDLTDFSPFRIEIQHRIKSWQDSSVTIHRFDELNKIYTSHGIKIIRNYFSHYIKELMRFSVAYPPRKGLNSLRVMKYVAKQTQATVLNIFVMLYESKLNPGAKEDLNSVQQ